MNKKKILNDPVYGFVTIPSELVFDLIEHPLFQRLRRIKQVGLTHYVYPGALHTRFHHALGAMHLMQQAVDTLRSKDVEITPEEAESAMISILLHDIGHGPYSHALEGLLLDTDHEAITMLLMQMLNEETGGALDMAIEIFQGKYAKKFLHELVTSQLDLDRLDYLKRDSFFTGVAEGQVGHDRIIKMLNVKDGRICVEQKGIYSIEKFLMARRLMYWQVYLHKAVIGAEQMLRRLITLVKKRLHSGEIPEMLPMHLRAMLTAFPNPNKDPDAREWLLRFGQLDDIDIDYMIKLLAAEKHPLTGYIAECLIKRHLFHTRLEDTPFSNAQISALVVKAADHFDLSHADARELVITGHELVPTYRTGSEEIQMLLKDGTLVTLSEMLSIQRDAVSQAYYLSYPKVLRDL